MADQYNPFDALVTENPVDLDGVERATDASTNEFDDIVTRDMRSGKSQALSSMQASMEVAPDTMVELRKMATDLNIDQVTGKEDPQRLRMAHIGEQTKDFLAEYPRAVAFLSDPKNTQLLWDDIPALKAVAAQMAQFNLENKDRSVVEFGESILKTFVAGGVLLPAFGLLQFGETVAQEATIEQQVAILGANVDFDRAAAGILRGEARNMDQEERTKFEAMEIGEQIDYINARRKSTPRGHEEYLQNASKITREELEKLQRMSPDGVLGWIRTGQSEILRMIPSAMVASLTGSPAAGAAVMGGQIFGATYAYARGEGRSHNAAAGEALLFGTLEYYTEKIPLGILTKRGNEGMLKNFFKAAGAEGIQESIMAMVQVGFDKLILDKDMTLGQALMEMSSSGAMGATIGGQLSLMGSSARLLSRAVGRPDDATDFERTLQNIRDAVNETKIIARSPETMREALEALAPEENQSVFVPAEKITELHQSGVLVSEELAALEQSETLQDAINRGGDIEVSTAALLTLNDDQFNALAPHVRRTISAPNAVEAKEQLKTREEDIQRVIDQMDTLRAADPETKPVFQIVKREAEKLGRSAEEADTVARLYQEYYETNAGLLDGVTAEQLFAEDNVEFRRGAAQTEALQQQELFKRTVEEFGTTEEELAKQLKLANGDVTQTPLFKHWFANSKGVDADGKPMVMYHGTHVEIEAVEEGQGPYRGGIVFFVSEEAAFASDFAGGTHPGPGGQILPVYIRAERPFDFRNSADVSTVIGDFFAQTGGFSDMDAARRVLHNLSATELDRLFDIELPRIRDTNVADFSQFVEWLVTVNTDTFTEDITRELVSTGSFWMLEIPELVEFITGAGFDSIVIEENGAINYALFEPNQIKSVFNQGTFSRVSNLILEQDAKKLPPEIPPQNKTKLTAADKKKLDKVKKAVPKIVPILQHLNPDEQAILTPPIAKNLLRVINSMPSSADAAAVAYAGRAKRGWYVNSARALQEIFGEDAQRFAALLAALSPQTSVESNTTNALKIWAAWTQEGRPTDEAVILRIMGEHVQGNRGEDSVLGAWKNNTFRALTIAEPGKITLSGPKVNSFMLNLIGFVGEVTNDAWMANYSGVDQQLFSTNYSLPSPGKGYGYLAMNVMMRRAGKMLTARTKSEWTPSEMQETIWSWAKALYEKAGERGETRTALQILQEGDLLHEDINSVADFEQLFLESDYRPLLEAGGYGPQLEALDAVVAARIAGDPPITGSSYDANDKQAAPHLHRAAKRLDALAAKRAAEAARWDIRIGISATTGTIPGLDTLHKQAKAGDVSASLLLQEVAADALRTLTSRIDSVEINMTPAHGLFGGDVEPSLGLTMSFQGKDRDEALAALERFAQNFNQEQIHVRLDADEGSRVGKVYDDGSYNTAVSEWTLAQPLSHAHIQQVIETSGLYGLTATDTTLTAYYVGDPTDAEAIKEFADSVKRATKSLGASSTGYSNARERLWTYGHGEGARQTYGSISGVVRPPKEDLPSVTAQRVATRLADRAVEPVTQGRASEAEQKAIQTEIMLAYEAMPLNDLSNPDVKQAYAALAAEVQSQYDALPIKVTFFEGEGEPYTTAKGAVSSAAMRKDINLHNHLAIFKTEAGNFGPPGVLLTDHPLLEDSGRTTSDGKPMLYNDLLRAVHDYYAHTMAVTTLGPKGEEAAWRNHMAMTVSPWARWALTTETRGQNSWVNFRPEVEGMPLRERGFADQKTGLLPLNFIQTGQKDIDANLSELPGSDGLVLEQRAEDGPRGTFHQEADIYGDISNIITLTAGADRSTFLHETGHFWLFNLNKRMNDERLTDEGRETLIRQWQATRKWFGDNAADAWRDIQKMEAAARAASASNPSDGPLRRKADALQAAVARANRGGGMTYMQEVADGFMDGTVEEAAVLEQGFHELWARGVERYLAEGKAPSAALRSTFSRFSTWLVGVYQKLVRLNVELTPEVRDVFDRLLASEQAIEEERQRLLYQVPAEVRAQVNSDEERALEELAKQAQQEARAEMQGKVAKELQRERTAAYKAAKVGVTEAVTQEVRQEPIHHARNLMMHGRLPDGTQLLDEKGNPTKMRLSQAEFRAVFGDAAANQMPPGAIAGKKSEGESADTVAGLAGYDSAEAMVAELTKPHQTEHQAVTSEVDRRMQEEFGSLLNPDQLADEAADAVQNDRQIELIATQARILRRLAAETLDKAAARRVEQNGAPAASVDREAREDAAAEAAEDAVDAVPGALRVTAADAQTKAGIPGRRAQQAATSRVAAIRRGISIPLLKEAAARYIENAPVMSLTPGKFRATADRLSRQAHKSVAARDYEVAAHLMEQSAFNMILAREAAAAQDFVKRSVRSTRATANQSDKKAAKTHDMAIFNAVRMVAEPYGLADFKDRNYDPRDAMQKLNEVDPAAYDDLNAIVATLTQEADDYIEASKGDRPYRFMPYGKYVQLINALKTLRSNARTGNQMRLDGELIEHDDISDEVGAYTARIDNSHKKPLYRGTPKQRWRINSVGTLVAGLRRVESWARWMDGGDPLGPINKYVVQPVEAAVVNYLDAKSSRLDSLLQILEPHRQHLAQARAIDAPELGNHVFLSKGELIHALLHTGNDSNKRKLLLGGQIDIASGEVRPWGTLDPETNEVDTTQWDRFLTRMIREGVIDRSDMQLVQDIWDLFETTKGDAQKAHYAMYGYYFTEVDAQEIVTPWGVFRGGYAPAITDKMMNPEGGKHLDADAIATQQSAAMFPGAEEGFTKGRVDYNQPLDLNLNLVPAHLDKVMKFSHLGPTIRQVARLAINKKFAATVGRVDRHAIDVMLIPWLQRTVTQTTTTSSSWREWDQTWRKLSSNVGMMAMAGNIVNAGQQLTGIASAMVILRNPANMASALTTWRKDGVGAREYITGRSRYMHNRMLGSVNDMMENIEDIMSDNTPFEKAQAFATRNAFFAQQFSQNIVDQVVWIAAEKEARSNGLHERVFRQFESKGPEIANEKAEAAVALFADSVVRQTQSPMRPEDISRLEASGAFTRMFFKFYSYFNNMFNLNTTEFKLAAEEIGWKGKPGRMFYLYVMGIAVPAIVAQGIAMLAKGRFDEAEEDEEELPWVLFELMGLSQIQFLAGMLPGGAGVANRIYGGVTPQFYDDRLSFNPIVSFADSTISSGQRFVTDWVKEGEPDAAKGFRFGLGVIGVGMGLPSNWLSKPVQYLYKIEEGKADPEGVGDYVQGFLTSRDGTQE